MERRGIHVLAYGRSYLAALERLIGEIAPSLGFNSVIVEVNGHFQYASHPEVAEPDSLSREDAGRLAELARGRGIQLVPMYNCLGHQSWQGKVVALLRAHPEFNEDPEHDPIAEDCWCPSHPEITGIVFDLFDELIEAFGAEAFHAGMDEVFFLGHCPLCKGTGNAALFAKAVNDHHGHLVGRRGVEMQMWGDRLLDAKTMGYVPRMWESSENETHQAVDMIPTDIVVCDWHYENVDEFPSLRFFQEKGFRVWPAGYNKEQSIRRFIEVARRDGTPRMLGYLATTWTDLNKLVAGLAGEPVESQEERLADIIGAVRLGAELARQ